MTTRSCGIWLWNKGHQVTTKGHMNFFFMKRFLYKYLTLSSPRTKSSTALLSIPKASLICNKNIDIKPNNVQMYVCS